MIVIMTGVLVIICIFIVTGISLKRSNSNYIQLDDDFYNLYKKYRLIDDISADIEFFTERKGKIDKDIKAHEVVYEEDAVEYVFHSETKKLIYVVVKNGNFEFGSKNVKIGMSKEELDKIFNNSKRPNPDKLTFALYKDGEEVLENAEVYSDDEYQFVVGLNYNNEGILEEIYIGSGPNN